MNGIPLNIDFQQILLHLFNVVILFAIIFFLIYKPVKDFMEKRQQEYKKMDDEAAGKIREAQELKLSYEDKINKAEEEINAMRAEASREMDERSREMEAEARESAQKIIDSARLQAETQKNNILESTKDQITKLAQDAASKAIFENPSQAFDSFLKAAEEQE